MQSMPRRWFLRRALQLSAAATALPRVLTAAQSCVDPASESLRASLHYTSVSTVANQSCSACGFFTPGGKSGCGSCVMMSGPVDETGRCDSWSARS